MAEVTSRCFDCFEPMRQPDGAFSYGPNGSLANHGGLALAPVKAQADVTGTALCCSALSLLANLCDLRQDLGWNPLTEWSMGLQGAAQRHGHRYAKPESRAPAGRRGKGRMCCWT